MRLFPATKAAALCLLALGVMVTPAHAQIMSQPLNGGTGTTTGGQMPPSGAISNAQAQQYARQMARMMQQGGLNNPAPVATAPVEQKPAMTQAELNAQLNDHDSAQFKANKLADQAKDSRALFGMPREIKEPNPLDEMPVPPPVEHLQRINETEGQNVSDDLITKKMSVDMRRDSQREAALSYGARGGLAKRSYEVLEEMRGYENTLDKVFNFRALLVKAPSGLLIEPPIVRESLDATVITEGGNEAAVADQILKINKQAKIVTAPRDWRQYLEMHYDTVITPPPKILWPRTAKEQASWNGWVKQGWDAGYEQGEQIFEANLAQMVADYSGMVRYRMLLTEGKISQPYALQEDRGVTGGRNEMRVGDRALRITGPSQFLTGRPMEAGRPVSLLKKGVDDLKETWPGEPDRFLEHHIDPFLLWCVKKNASDITWQSNRAVMCEIYGSLYPSTYRSLDAADMTAAITRLYGTEALAILAGGADIDLSYEIMIDRFTRVRFRVNMTAILADGRDGCQITMRTLPQSPPTFTQLGIEDAIVKNWRPRQGIVLVTGPTGSGKSTLLAAGIRGLIESVHGCGKLLTYEAPIEFTYDSIISRRSLVAQTEIPRHLPTFAAGVRNALRRKPEIILVGESRDRETISASIEAAQTGHLVFSTVHTTGVASTIRRMVSTFEPGERNERAFSLMETIRLIVTQTLVPKIGGGRVALREYMTFTEEIRETLLNMTYDKWPYTLMQMVAQHGKTMESSAKDAFDAGKIEKRHYLVYMQGSKAARKAAGMKVEEEDEEPAGGGH